MGILNNIGTRLDDLRSVWDPKGAAERKRQRQGYWGYQAAEPSRKNGPASYMQNTPADTIDKRSRHTLRARARDLEKNSAMTGSIIKAFQTNVIGSGFNMQSRTGDEEFDKRIETLWRRWCHHENCDYTRQQNMDDLTKMVITRYLIDGGILVTFPIDKDRMIPLTLRFHEVDEFDTTESVARVSGDRVLVHGVEMTKTGQPLAYWLQQVAADGFTQVDPVRIPAEDCEFLWDRERPTQYREITPLHAVITATQDLHDYVDAVSFQQKAAACVGAYIETENTMAAPGRAVNTPTNERVERIEGGSVKYLNPGEKAKFLLPSGQAQEANTFIATQERSIAAPLGLSLESTSRNVERVNYSSARQNLLIDNMTYSRMKRYLEEYFFRPVYRRFVDMCYLVGLLDGTGFTPGDESYYESVIWLSNSIGWIDPKKEAEADNITLANGGQSFQEYCAAHGADWRERIDAMAEVKKYAESKGVDLKFNNDASGGSNNDESNAGGGASASDNTNTNSNSNGGGE